MKSGGKEIPCLVLFFNKTGGMERDCVYNTEGGQKAFFPAKVRQSFCFHKLKPKRDICSNIKIINDLTHFLFSITN
jgi:hypothetical protein